MLLLVSRPGEKSASPVKVIGTIPSCHENDTESSFAGSGVLQGAVGFGHRERLDDRLDSVPGRECEHLGRVAH